MAKNKWIYCSSKVQNELPSPPQLLLENAEIVKHNPVRDVFFKDGYFIKCDYRKRHGFEKEFKAAQQLAKKNIATVEHLACGSHKNCNYLITRALEDSQTVEEYLLKSPADELFKGAFAGFLDLWRNSPFFHTDAHLGNLLYQPGKNSLTLVDVRGVKKRSLWKKRYHGCPADVARFIFNFRGSLSCAEVLDLLTQNLCSEPEKVFQKMLKKECARILKEWPKRSRQLFSGYPKFSRITGENMLVLSAFQGTYLQYPEETSPDAGSEFAASFFLSLLQIPHRRVCAADLNTNRLRREPERSGVPVSPEELSHLQYALEQCGLENSPSRWQNIGGIPYLTDISPLISMPLFTQRS